MKLLTKKWVVYLLITMMAVPTMLFASIAGAKPAMAATSEPTAISTDSASPTDLALPTDSATPTVPPTIESTATPTVSETPTIIPEPTTLEPTPTQSPSQWTFEKVELNKEYVAPQNSGVKLTFTKLPDPSGNIKIEEITLTQEQIKQTGSLSDKAYDITSDMVDGSFTYNLSLPIPASSKGKTVDVKFSEDLSNIGSAAKVENTLTKTYTSVSVNSLDHFTIFVVVNPTPTGASCVSAGADTGTGCYSTIQAAIGAAAPTGDIINVAAGTYTENLTINKSLTLSGVGDATLINGNINVTGDNVIVQNLKITNSDFSGYGVKATAGKALTLENVTIDVLYYGVRMAGGISAISTTITLNNSRIKGFAAISLDGAGATNAVVTVFQTSLTGTTSYSGTSDDFAVIAIDNTSGVHVNFTGAPGTSSVTNEFTGGAQAKEHLIRFATADAVVVTGTPTYTNAANSTVNAGALFVSGYGPYTNIVEGQVVARYVYNTSTFEAALADNSVTTPIVVGRYETAIDTTAGTKTLNAGVTLIIEDYTPVTISGVTALVNNGAIIIESGAIFTNSGIISGTGTINLFVNTGGTVGCFSSIQTAINTAPSGAIINVAAGTYAENVVIDKSNITLTGASSTTTILNADSVSPSNDGTILIRGASPFCSVLDGVTIQNVTVNQSSPDGFAIIAESGGCSPDLAAYNTNLTLSNIVVNGGTHGIGFNSVDSATLDHVSVSNVNTVSDEGALELTGARNITITNSLFNTNNVGIRVQLVSDPAYGSNGPIAIHSTQLINNTFAIQNQDSGITLDATNNWWGNASGPFDNKGLPGTPNYNNPLGTGNSVTSYVDYKPWYTNAEMTTLNYMAPTFTTSAGQGKSINITFSNVQPGTPEYDVYINSKKYAIYFPTASTYNILVLNYGTYSIYAVARYGSAFSINSATQTLTLSAPVAPVVKSSVGSSLTTPTTAQAATTAPATAPATPSVGDQGKIKAAEDTSSSVNSKINWTPWIILFILILLAGAATGGYFYWFGGDSETAAATVVIKDKKVVATAPKDAGKNPSVKSDKKSRRW